MALRNKKKSAWADQRKELLYAMDWSDYMTAKKAKLEEQFQEAAQSEFAEPTSNIFNGIAIFVNGYTNPTADELKRLMMDHGGIYHHYLRSKTTTHMIASNLPYTKIVSYRKAQNPLPLCKPEWITDSIKAGKLLDYRKYLLYSQCTESQPSLFQMAKQTKVQDHITNNPKSSTSTSYNTKTNLKVTNIHNKMSDNVEKSSEEVNSTKNPEFITEFYNNSRLHHIATMGAMFKDYINELRDASDGKFPGLEALKKQSSCNKNDKVILYNTLNNSDSEEDLFDDYSKPKIKSKVSLSSNTITTIMHIDMDCFFVSVGLRKHPELKGFPIAVAHAKGNKQGSSNDEIESMSEVASCSYEARKAGIKNGMFLGKALKLCPNLKTIRYDFEAYKEVSQILYNTIASYTLDIEAVSCDEMYVDCSKILQETNLTPMEFATVIRNQIKEKTGCTVSTGFGENKLQARIATKKAKPNGQYFLHGNEVRSVIRNLSVKDLPGVGYSISDKLSQLNVKTCGDLEVIPVHVLQKEFGKKTGQQLYNMCRGIDNSKLNLEHVRKSVSAEVNYGIRFKDTNSAHTFLKKLSEEVSDRLKKNNCKGKCVTLKVMFKSKEAPEPRKFMGHGICDTFNKSKNLIAHTDDSVIIARETINLWNQFNQNPEDARGIGIQISKLESKLKPSGPTLETYFNKMEVKNVPASTSLNHNKLSNNSTSKIQKVNIREVTNNEHETNNTNTKSDTIKEQQKFLEKQILNKMNMNRCSYENPNKQEKQETKLENIVATRNISENKPVANSSSNTSSQLKQMTHLQYFKQKKPNNKVGKMKLPDIKEIDLKVLIELPVDIRNEIIDQYKENNENENSDEILQQESTIHDSKQNENVECNNPNETLIINKDIGFSQVDPEYLAALPDDIKNEVKSYCDAKKKSKLPVKNEKQNMVLKRWNIFKPEKKPLKNAKRKINNKTKMQGKVKKETKLIVESSTSKILNKNETNADIPQQESQTSKSTLNATVYFDPSYGIKEHNEILTDLVRCLLDLPIENVRMQIKQWVISNSEINDVDFLSFTTYLGTLPKKKRLSDLHTLLESLHMYISKSTFCQWHKAYKKMVKHIQVRMLSEYGYPLMVPTYIDCMKCT
ncbi:DNA repair protein REV1 [Trichogramma pretiosum]|uniref:DNA repair protein REV1 n=1 Tax=Trichogramma pretiosum TaxID=7493 RepID=UPI000C71B5DD|nr:DNA repair protein REV1 [Trichogramma pretiosum]